MNREYMALSKCGLFLGAPVDGHMIVMNMILMNKKTDAAMRGHLGIHLDGVDFMRTENAWNLSCLICNVICVTILLRR